MQSDDVGGAHRTKRRCLQSAEPWRIRRIQLHELGIKPAREVDLLRPYRPYPPGVPLPEPLEAPSAEDCLEVDENRREEERSEDGEPREGESSATTMGSLVSTPPADDESAARKHEACDGDRKHVEREPDDELEGERDEERRNAEKIGDSSESTELGPRAPAPQPPQYARANAQHEDVEHDESGDRAKRHWRNRPKRMDLPRESSSTSSPSSNARQLMQKTYCASADSRRGSRK